MDYSYTQPTTVQCSACTQTATVDVWVIVDAATRPELVQDLQQGTLNTLKCPHCDQSIGIEDEPLLVYRPTEQPSLIFSPASKTAFAEDQAHEMQHLVQHLLETLDNTDDDWVMEGLKRVPRHQLVAVLNEHSSS